ncbi:MAG: SDR family oxidoreductase [Anaerolineae bacterium]|nr:SDR family oxidoreductase [Anaerolineae bacterium]
MEAIKCAGKVALVTGAAGKGMGRSIALTLAREGASVAVNYRTSREQAQAIVEAIAAQGGQAIAVQSDVFTAKGCRHLVDAALAQFGRIDVCVIGPGGGWHPEPVEQMDAVGALEDVQHELAPLFHLLPLVLPGMYERRWGRIMGIAMHPDKPSPAYAYNVGKAARLQALLLAQSQAWANGVTVNVIAPGPVAAIENLEKALDQCAHGTGWLDRGNVSPQDIAEGVAFLCSEAGRFVTGMYCATRFIDRKRR